MAAADEEPVAEVDWAEEEEPRTQRRVEGVEVEVATGSEVVVAVDREEEASMAMEVEVGMAPGMEVATRAQEETEALMVETRAESQAVEATVGGTAEEGRVEERAVGRESVEAEKEEEERVEAEKEEEPREGMEVHEHRAVTKWLRPESQRMGATKRPTHQKECKRKEPER